MVEDSLVQLIAISSWIVAVTRRATGYRCWVITPELSTLSDCETYPSSEAALAVGRSLVQCSTEPEIDFSRCRLYD